MRRLRGAACAALAVWLCVCAGCGNKLPEDATTDFPTESASETAARSPLPDDISLSQIHTTDADCEPSTDDALTQTETVPSETAHVHAYASEVVAPTCTKGGYTVKTCACGNTIRTDETEPLGHAFDKPIILRASTCTVNGEQKNVCTRCGYSETVLSPRAPHDFTAWVITQNATESLKGEETCRCKVCGYTLTRLIPEKSAAVYTEAEEALAMLDLINASRKQAGVRPLAFDYARYVCAEVRAREATESFSHTRPNGEDFSTVVREQGCAAPDAWAENLQYSTNRENTIERAHEVLMASEEHRENILDPKYATVAICVLRCDKGTYIAQLFFS